MAEGLSVGDLAERVRELATKVHGPRRVLVGITGPPGAGKSTLAGAVADELGPSAALAPMDGFHLRDEELRARSMLAVKGSPPTFDVGGVLAALRSLRAVPRVPVLLPAYDRALHDPVPAAIDVDVGVDVVVTEGNYLLYEEDPWDEVSSFLDEVWYLDVDLAVARERLVQRYLVGGRSLEEARERSDGFDMGNAELVEKTAGRADLLLTPLPRGRFLVREP